MFITNQRTDFKDFLHTCFKNSHDGIELHLIEIFCLISNDKTEPQYFESLGHGVCSDKFTREFATCRYDKFHLF